MGSTECIPARKPGQDDLYREAVTAYGAALERFARGYEADPDRRRDLVQEIHLALWRSFEGFEARCSLRTWVYRVAHNTAASHVLKDKRARLSQWVDLEYAAATPDPAHEANAHADADLLARLIAFVQTLKPPDRQVMLLYLDALDAKEIGEITGLSAGAVATRIHRIKAILARRFNVTEQP